MTIKRTLQRGAALWCAAALTLCLAGCDRGREDPTGPTGPSLPAASGELLAAALDASGADLEARFAAALPAGMPDLSGGVSARAEMSFPDGLGEALGTLSGALEYDPVSGQARADLTLSPGDTPLSLYYGPEFMGLSCEAAFGSGAFYGLRPYGFAEQLAGTDLAELFQIDLEAMEELDRLLASVPKDVNVFTAPTLDRVLQAAHELIRELDLTWEAASLTRGGRELDATNFRAVVPAGDLADFLKKLTVALPDWVLAYGAGSGDKDAASVDQALESLRQSGADTSVTFTVAEGKLYHVSAEYAVNGSTTRMEAELYGDDGRTVQISVEPRFSLTLDLADGVSAELERPGGSTTRLHWGSDHSFEFITYQNDVTDLALEGTLTAEEGALTFDGIWYSGERGDRNPLTFTAVPGGQVVPPETERSLTELSSRELYTALAKLVFDLAY